MRSRSIVFRGRLPGTGQGVLTSVLAVIGNFLIRDQVIGVVACHIIIIIVDNDLQMNDYINVNNIT